MPPKKKCLSWWGFNLSQHVSTILKVWPIQFSRKKSNVLSGCNAGCGRFCHFPSCFWHLVARMVKIRRVRKELNLSIDSHTADVHVGVSLNGGTPHFTPQIMIIFSRTNPIGCWGNPPFFRKPTRYEFWQSPQKKKHGNVVFPPLMDLPRSPTRPFWGRSCLVGLG